MSTGAGDSLLCIPGQKRSNCWTALQMCATSAISVIRVTPMMRDQSDHSKIGLANIMNQLNIIGCGAREDGGFGRDYLQQLGLLQGPAGGAAVLYVRAPI
jgi:hypothetical protein